MKFVHIRMKKTNELNEDEKKGALGIICSELYKTKIQPQTEWMEKKEVEM